MVFHKVAVFSLTNLVKLSKMQIVITWICNSNIIIIESIVPSRNIGCLWVLSTSEYQLLGTLVYSSFYPLPWLLISSCFSVFLSSRFLDGSKEGHPLVLLHPLFLMCDQSIKIFFFLFLFLATVICWGRKVKMK